MRECQWTEPSALKAVWEVQCFAERRLSAGDCMPLYHEWTPHLYGPGAVSAFTGGPTRA
jgi:hypothetical protein